jgi:hypothetical protein
MRQPTQNNFGAVVIDANILISICSKEPSEAAAKAALADYIARNWAFYFADTTTRKPYGPT